MLTNQLKEYLDKHQVKYVSVAHSPAFTSQEIAASAHISGRALAKTVVVKIDGNFAMVVVPANQQVNFIKVRDAAGAKMVDLASESEFKDKFVGCEVGAMPPFGELYEMPVYLSSELSQQEHLIFNAGSHSELMQITVGDFDRLVKPVVVEL